jgi:hypothetical protein
MWELRPFSAGSMEQSAEEASQWKSDVLDVSGLAWLDYPLVMTNSLLLKMAIYSGFSH